tara:strand:+ start:11192 stop:12901 length:1710 start_codon:yes stop_codon:yes gene_type:complete
MNYIYKLIPVFLLCPSILVAQTAPDYCGTNDGPENHSLTIQGDGEFITSHGTLNVLVVFVRFPDDNGASNHWPASGFPSLTSSFIDSTTTQNSTNYVNITNYFDQMSLGQFNVIGDVVTTTATNSSDYYITDSSFVDNKWEYTYDRYNATKDVLISLDNDVVFSKYDNWTNSESFQNSNSSDGIVDMIFMVWKGSWFGGWRGEASLGYGSDILVDNDSTTIKTRYRTSLGSGKYKSGGSGVTIHDNSGSGTLLNSVKHELGHYLLGSGHPYGSFQNRIASMMQWGEPSGRSTNAEERERLGWISVPEITQNSSNIELDDFITTGDAYKYDITPGNGSDYEYLYFENHQKLSIYDDATRNSSDKGLIVLHDKASNKTSEFVRYLLTDGDWDFENVYPYAIEHPSPSNASILPVWEKVNPDPSNFGDNMSRRRYVFIQNSPNTNDTTIRQFVYALKEDGNITVEPFFQGVNITSTFNPDKYSTLSKITNPKTREFNSSNGPDFYMNVVSQTGNKLYVDFEVNHDPYTINENTDWDRQIFLDNSASISNSAVLTLAPETGIYSNTTGGIVVV